MKYRQREEQSKLGQRQGEEAVELAMRGSWEEAVVVNQGIIEGIPGDVSAHNRLGKAFFELGEYPQAIEAYNNSLKLEPGNSIAIKNIARLRERLGITEESSSEVTGQEPQPASIEMDAVPAKEERIEKKKVNKESSFDEEENIPEGFSLLD